jgi:amino acid permease
MGPGSLRGSILNLCNTAIGAGMIPLFTFIGVLSLPYVFKRSGFIVGFVFIFLAAIAAYQSLMLLVKLADKEKVNNYSQLAARAGGPKL